MRVKKSWVRIEKKVFWFFGMFQICLLDSFRVFWDETFPGPPPPSASTYLYQDHQEFKKKFIHQEFKKKYFGQYILFQPVWCFGSISRYSVWFFDGDGSYFCHNNDLSLENSKKIILRK